MLVYYASYNNEGEITGFYNPDINSNIPEPNIELNEQEWLDLVINQGLRKIDITDKQIIKIDKPKPDIVAFPNWTNLTNNLRGSAIFGKTYAIASSDTKVNAAFTVLLSCVNSANPNIEDLQFALTQLKALLGNTLTPEDIDTLNNLLINNNFPFTV